MSRTVTEQDCISALKEFSEINGEKPSVRKYRKYYNNNDVSWPHDETIKNKFGSWNNAMAAAGFEIEKSTVLGQQRDGCPSIINLTEDEFSKLNKFQRYRKRKQAKWAKRMMESGCDRCGYDGHPAALEYHHIDGKGDKDVSVSTLIAQGYGDERIKQEVEKCQILCANCHSIETNGDIYDVSGE